MSTIKFKTNAQHYRTDSCSVCDEQQCEGDLICSVCRVDLYETQDFMCDGGDHYCSEECYLEAQEEENETENQ